MANYQQDPPEWRAIRVFDGIPNYVNEVINGMTVIYHKKTNSFTDMFGNTVDMPVNSNGHTYYAEGYYRAAWDLRCGNLRLSEDKKTLYRRDVDMSGKTRKLRTWHEVASLEGEYGIPSGRQRIRAWNRFIFNEADKNPPVYRGMRFNNYACLRTRNGVEVYQLNDDDDKAFIFCDMNAKTDKETVKWQFHTACQWTTWLTADEHSAQNLTRMFATPFLEPYKHLTYVLYGGGGNGKGILLGRMARQYPKYASAFNTKRFADGKGFTAEQESRKIIGKYWLFDEEADVLDQNSMTQIKRLSTGEAVVARKIGENAMTFQPKATLVIATNEPFVSAQAEASNRRFVFIRMKEGRSAKDFETFINWIDANGIIPFLYASCYTWAKCGDNPWNDVTIGGQYDMTDSEEWVRDCICRDGYAISKDNPYGKRFATTSRNKLGLRSTARYVKKLGATIRVLEVNDEKRFQPYREAFENDMANAQVEEEEQTFGSDIPNLPNPINVTKTSTIDPETYGFRCKLAPAIAHGENQKKSYEWHSSKPNQDDQQARDIILNHEQAYAVVPDQGFIIVDMDRDASEDGWARVNTQVGLYGTTDFPRTFLVKTPSGGVHAYYRIPKQWQGRIKNMAHPNGIPVDTRLENKGYAIGAQSVLDMGSYELCDLPENSQVPDLSPAMIDWMKDNGYMEEPRKRRKPNLTIPTASEAEPDMSVVPEGQRNQVLHDWAYGRLANHPENANGIKQDLFSRGRMSGLKDRELTTIWNSVTRQLGE